VVLGRPDLYPRVVTTDLPDGYRLFAVELGAEPSRPGTFAAVGLAETTASLWISLTRRILSVVPAVSSNALASSTGAISVAACWYGVRRLGAQAPRPTGHARALALPRLGAIDASWSGLSSLLVVATALERRPGFAHARRSPPGGE
jgi:hypothetical protein